VLVVRMMSACASPASRRRQYSDFRSRGYRPSWRPELALAEPGYTFRSPADVRPIKSAAELPTTSRSASAVIPPHPDANSRAPLNVALTLPVTNTTTIRRPRQHIITTITIHHHEKGRGPQRVHDDCASAACAGSGLRSPIPGPSDTPRRLPAVCHDCSVEPQHLVRNAFVDHVGSSRCARVPQFARCWNRPRLSRSVTWLWSMRLDSTIVVVTAMTAARSASPVAWSPRQSLWRRKRVSPLRWFAQLSGQVRVDRGSGRIILRRRPTAWQCYVTHRACRRNGDCEWCDVRWPPHPAIDSSFFMAISPGIRIG